MKIVYFNYASLLILIVVLISSFLKKQGAKKTNLALLSVIAELFITTVIGCICLNLDNFGPGNITAKYIFHGLYLILHSLTSLIYIFYLMVLLDCWFKVYTYKRCLLIFIPSILIVATVIANYFTHHLFWITEDGVYTKSKLLFVLYGLSFINLLYCLYLSITNKKLFPRRTYYSIILLFPLIFLPMIFENFFPNIVVEPFGNVLGVMLIAMNIQRPEELIDPKTKLYNKNSYNENFRKAEKNHKQTRHIFINLVNYRSLRNIIGYETGFELSSFVAQEIKKINTLTQLHGEIYYLKNGQYRIIVSTRNYYKIDKATEMLSNLFQKTLYYEDIELNFETNICVVKVPQEINNYEALTVFGNDLQNKKYYSGSVLYTKDIYKLDYYQKLQNIDKIIEDGFAKNNYSVYFQPIYNTATQTFNSAEALIRLNDDKFGFISPESFIPAAENSGAIHKIDNFILEEVCKFIASKDFADLGLDFIQVNLSVIHCMQDNLPAQIEELVQKYQIDPHKINLEFSETTINSSQQKLLENSNKLTNQDISISLDHFGSGYSNLKILSQLPVNIVKIDKELTTETSNPKISVIIKKTIEILKSLNMKIVVIGVETPEIYSYFTDLECDYLQGVFFSEPLPVDKFIKFLKEAK